MFADNTEALSGVGRQDDTTADHGDNDNIFTTKINHDIFFMPFN